MEGSEDEGGLEKVTLPLPVSSLDGGEARPEEGLGGAEVAKVFQAEPGEHGAPQPASQIRIGMMTQLYVSSPTGWKIAGLKASPRLAATRAPSTTPRKSNT